MGIILNVISTLISALIVYDLVQAPNQRWVGLFTKDPQNFQLQSVAGIMLVSAHIVLTKDDRSQSLVLTGEDGRGGGNDQLVIAGNNMGGPTDQGGSSNMIMQDAENREGDIVMNGNSMIIPGEDGHIVLADSRSKREDSGQQSGPQFNSMLAFWLPYMRGGFRTPYSTYGLNMFG